MNVIKTALLLLSAASLLTLPLNAFAQEAQGKQALLEAYTALQAQPQDSMRQVRFFEAYPQTFAELQSCFVGNRFQAPAVDYLPYLKAFEQLSLVSDQAKIARLFDIMTGGHWAADAPSMHFALMRDLMRKQPQAALALIAKEDSARQRLLWQCYWQNPTLDPSQAQDYKRYQQVRGYKLEKRIMSEAYATFRGQLPLIE